MDHSSRLENFKALISAGQAAIRTMLALNGGAAVAMLAFIGHLATGDAALTIPTFAGCLSLFAGGALAAGLVSGGTYLTQWLYARNDIPGFVRAGHIRNVVVILVDLASFCLFAWGMIAAGGAFSA